MEKRSFVKFPGGRYTMPTMQDAKLGADDGDSEAFKNSFLTDDGWIKESRYWNELYLLKHFSCVTFLVGCDSFLLVASFVLFF
jgi:hypothetical protein